MKPHRPESSDLAVALNRAVNAYYAERGKRGQVEIRELCRACSVLVATYLQDASYDNRIVLRDTIIRGLLEAVPRENRPGRSSSAPS